MAEKEASWVDDLLVISGVAIGLLALKKLAENRPAYRCGNCYRVLAGKPPICPYCRARLYYQ